MSSFEPQGPRVFPELQTSRLLLNPLQVSDGNEVLTLFASEQVVEFYDLKVMTRVEEAQDLIRLLQDRYEARQGIR